MIERSEAAPTADRTRDCLDPWKMALVKANGDVALCCWGEPVGSIHEQDLDTLLRGPVADERRARLISGELGTDCQRCPARGWTSPTALRDRLEEFLRGERERRAMSEHCATLERELGHLRAHADTLAHELFHLRPHAEALEHELTQLRRHAATLATELSHLRPHAARLSTDLVHVRGHAQSVGQELAHMRPHAAALANELAHLRPHAALLSAELAQLRPHAAALANELAQLRPHADTLSTELAHLRPHAAFLENRVRELQQLRELARETVRLRAHAAALEAQRAQLEKSLSTGFVGWWRRTTGPIKRILRGRDSAPSPRAMRCGLEALRFTDTRIDVAGWVFLPGEPFDELRLIVDGHDLGALERLDRPDVLATYPHVEEARRAGFTGSFHSTSRASDAWRNVRIVGCRAGRALGQLELEAPRDPSVLGPVPPEHLMHRVAHLVQPELFRLDGLIAATAVLRVLARHGASAPARLLDWGAGCGRVLSVLRAQLPGSELAGVDIDAEAIGWLRAASAELELAVVALDPPTALGSERFDVILGLSVMTHLDRTRQRAWLVELNRLLAPGGLLVLSVHGPHAARIVGIDDVRAALERDGISDGTVDATLDGVVPAREYRATFQTEAWTRAEWMGQFSGDPSGAVSIVEWIPGGLSGFQDLVVLRKSEHDAPPPASKQVSS